MKKNRRQKKMRSVFPSVSTFVNPLVSASESLSISLLVCPSVCWTDSPCVHPPANLPICPSIFLTLYLSICPSRHLFLHPPIHPIVCLYIYSIGINSSHILETFCKLGNLRYFVSKMIALYGTVLPN